MTRRDLLGLLSASAVTGCAQRRGLSALAGGEQPDWSFDAKDGVRLPCPGLRRPVKIWVLADTHLALRDARDNEHAGHCARMARWPGNPKALPLVLRRAKEEHVDKLLLLGDNVSFPTLANVEFLKGELDRCGLDWSYVAGNHDWHFEGDAGSDFDQRDRWIERRLKPLYGGRDPLKSSVTVGGVRIVLIDNSLYHVTSEQLAFFRQELAKGDPTVLAMHIPFWHPGWGVTTCACPAWGAANDPYWQIEGRMRWAEKLLPSTFEFKETALAASNLVAVLAGHQHRFQAAVERGKPMLTAVGNAEGEILQAVLVPA